MAHLVALNSDQIQAFLDKNGGIAVVDCFATWCGPCKMIGPYVEKKNQTTGIPLITVDVDQAPDISEAYDVSAMPSFFVIKGKWDNIVATVVGGGQPNVDKIFALAQEKK